MAKCTPYALPHDVYTPRLIQTRATSQVPNMLQGEKVKLTLVERDRLAYLHEWLNDPQSSENTNPTHPQP